MAKRKVNKMNKDEEFSTGDSGEEVGASLVPEGPQLPSPVNKTADEVISSFNAEKTFGEKLEERVALLEQKGSIACMYSCTVCPMQFVQRMEELEEKTENFNPRHLLSVTDVRQVQISMSESIKLSLGIEAYTLYKLCRYNVSAKFGGLSYSQSAAKKVGAESPLYKEFSSTYNKLHTIADELDAPLEYAVSKREAYIVVAKRTYFQVFVELLNTMKSSSKISLASLVNLVDTIYKGLTLLFGEHLTGGILLREWLQMASGASEKTLSRQKALSMLRRFFPFRCEIDPFFYRAWGLEQVDEAAKEGRIFWPEEKTEEQETALASSVQKKPTKISESYFSLQRKSA